MTTKSQTKNGLAWEYAILKSLYDRLVKLNSVSCDIVQNNKLLNSKQHFESLSQKDKDGYTQDADKLVDRLIAIENEKEVISGNCIIEMLPDKSGGNGDVRDIIVIKTNGREIGVSAKNNSGSAKSPRISKSSPDPLAKWTNGQYQASGNFKSAVVNLFSGIEKYVLKKTSGKIISGCVWDDLPSDISKDKIYTQMVKLFCNEIDMMNKNKGAVKELFLFLVGRQDYYKLLRWANGKLQMKLFNHNNSLAKGHINMPSKIIKNEITNGKNNTIDIVFDNGWKFSLRFHNGSSGVQTSLKIEVEKVIHPDTLYVENL